MTPETYPVILEPDDNDTILVSFPDFPEAHTFGDTKDDALARAVEALETVIDGYIRDKRPIPAPSKRRGEAVALPALVAAKVQLYHAMRAAQVNKAELARGLNVHLPQVDRLLNIRHRSKIDQLEAAAKALGGELVVTVTTTRRVQGASRAARVAKRRRSRTGPARRRISAR